MIKRKLIVGILGVILVLSLLLTACGSEVLAIGLYDAVFVALKDEKRLETVTVVTASTSDSKEVLTYDKFVAALVEQLTTTDIAASGVTVDSGGNMVIPESEQSIDSYSKYKLLMRTTSRTDSGMNFAFKFELPNGDSYRTVLDCIFVDDVLYIGTDIIQSLLTREIVRELPEVSEFVTAFTGVKYLSVPATTLGVDTKSGVINSDSAEYKALKSAVVDLVMTYRGELLKARDFSVLSKSDDNYYTVTLDVGQVQQLLDLLVAATRVHADKVAYVVNMINSNVARYAVAANSVEVTELSAGDIVSSLVGVEDYYKDAFKPVTGTVVFGAKADDVSKSMQFSAVLGVKDEMIEQTLNLSVRSKTKVVTTSVFAPPAAEVLPLDSLISTDSGILFEDSQGIPLN